MNQLLAKLKGTRCLDEALEHRLQRIVAIGRRGPDFVLPTRREGGYAQAELYPTAANAKAAVKR